MQGEKIGEVRLEVLGRREVRITDERFRIDVLGDVDQILQEGADARRR